MCSVCGGSSNSVALPNEWESGPTASSAWLRRGSRTLHARNASKDECQSPAAYKETGHCASNHKTNQDANELANTPPAHDARACRASKVIAHERSTGREIARFTNTQHHA